MTSSGEVNVQPADIDYTYGGQRTGGPCPSVALTTSNITLHDTIWSTDPHQDKQEGNRDPEPVIITPPPEFRSGNTDVKTGNPRLLSLSVSEADSDRSFSSQDTVIHRMELTRAPGYSKGSSGVDLMDKNSAGFKMHLYPGDQSVVSPVPGSAHSCDSHDGSDDTGLSSDIGHDLDRHGSQQEAFTNGSLWLAPSEQSHILTRSNPEVLFQNGGASQVLRHVTPAGSTGVIPRRMVADVEDDDGYDSPGGACGSDVSSTESNSIPDNYVTRLPEIKEDRGVTHLDQTESTKIRVLKKISPHDICGYEQPGKGAPGSSNRRHNYLSSSKIPSFREMNKSLKGYRQPNGVVHEKQESSLEKQLRLLTIDENYRIDGNNSEDVASVTSNNRLPISSDPLKAKDSLSLDKRKLPPVSEATDRPNTFRKYRSIISTKLNNRDSPKQPRGRRVRFADPIMDIAPEDFVYRGDPLAVTDMRSSDMSPYLRGGDVEKATGGCYSFKHNHLLYTMPSTGLHQKIASVDASNKASSADHSPDSVSTDVNYGSTSRHVQSANHVVDQLPRPEDCMTDTHIATNYSTHNPISHPHSNAQPAQAINDTECLYIKPGQTKDILQRLNQMKRSSIAPNHVTSSTQQPYAPVTSSLKDVEDTQDDLTTVSVVYRSKHPLSEQSARPMSATIQPDSYIDQRQVNRPPDYIHPPLYHPRHPQSHPLPPPSPSTPVVTSDLALPRQNRPQFASSADIYSMLHRSSKNPFRPGGVRYQGSQQQ